MDEDHSGVCVCPFSTKKYAKMSVFLVKTLKIRALLPHPHSLRRLGALPPDPRLYPPLPNLGCATEQAYEVLPPPPPNFGLATPLINNIENTVLIAIYAVNTTGTYFSNSVAV